METRIIIGFFVISNILLVVGADFNRENFTTTRFVSNEVEEYSTNVPKNHKRKKGLVDTRPASRKFQIFLQNDSEIASDLETPKDSDPIEEGNRKILRFGKRVFESILRHGVMAKDVRLLKSGKYQIDWWKQNRRLEGMRKRLSEELERNPKLKLRLHSLGWRSSSEQISYYKKINADNPDIQNPTISPNRDAKNTILYKILIMGFETEEPETNTPTKFSLSTIDQKDFGGTVSDFGVISVMNEEMSSSSEERSSILDSSGQVVDSDRLLQLIALVVEELRQGLMSEEERRSFRWIFGKRLWQLLEHEASKQLVETMDHDLAKFLFKGELPECDADNARRGRHQRRKTLDQMKRKSMRHAKTHGQRKEHHRDYNFENKNYNDYYKGTKGWISIDFNEEKKNKDNTAELIDRTTKYESRKLDEKTKKRKNKEKNKKNKWNHYDYDDNSYDDGYYSYRDDNHYGKW